MADQNNEMGMVERVARALAAEELPHITGDPDLWKVCIPSARTAIKALREPSVAMIDAAADAWAEEPALGRSNMSCALTAALDAALSHDEVKG